MITRFLFVICLSFLSSTIFSNNDIWGPTGHRATGKIAEKHLTKRAKKKIDKLLKGESLAFVSTYADEIKSDRKYSKYYPWHYVNMPLDTDYEHAEKNPKGDLVTGINHCIKVLKDENSTEEDKRFFLKMLVHLVGDLHQPLHIGRKEDKGGNTIQVQWHRKGSNLHRVWDENMLHKWDMSYIELAENAQDLSKAQIKEIEKGDVLDWVKDTHQLTKKVYSSAKTGDKLSYRYSYLYFPVVRQQLQKGGIRLAKLLNEIFC
ncbi:S1/P1 Nuclease [Tenacibaculum holothuriorum]|uniref:S1/P1 Nuclease n=1 Tax=Tenacibaculum holothuriorum TaxID=1635173 RepID=A0A1Y2PE19_9FLAO|nr:S1/P1 nuclease [Tenacibaculum holothuriorum]OSY87979.1 S1/P1 Nuclease [Tenacibaculum holothuriorum]